jgi:hypothetical protein
VSPRWSRLRAWRPTPLWLLETTILVLAVSLLGCLYLLTLGPYLRVQP